VFLPSIAISILFAKEWVCQTTSTLASHPFVTTRDTMFARATAPIFYLIWQETLKAATSSKGLKVNKLMQTVCKFHMHINFSWPVIIA